MRARTARINDADIVDLLRSIERMDGLPIRPASARFASAPPAVVDMPQSMPARPTSVFLIDPGWALARSRHGSKPWEPSVVVADHAWWSNPPGSAAQEAIVRLWRHSVAVSFAARKLAIEANDPDPDAVARAGLLHNLGLWVLASVEPTLLVEWFGVRNSTARRELERRWLGSEAADLGRHLAVRWRCEPLVGDAAWLHSDISGNLNASSSHPSRLAMIQQGFDRARRTPWAPSEETFRDPASSDPRVRILIAEVQARCGCAWVDSDVSPREERMTRENARLKLENARLLAGQAARDRFLETLASSAPTDSPETWADRACRAWCEEPGIVAAQVDWTGMTSEPPQPPNSVSLTPTIRPPSSTLSLGDLKRPTAEIRLWRGEDEIDASSLEPHPAQHAWNAWSREVEERTRLRRQLDQATSALRARTSEEADARRLSLVEGLAEFAAGAGHELNNPLAVILGRAQLVLARVQDPDAQRSLQAIITQAQRAHRILRDLMYVARPPEPRVLPCQPDEIVRNSIRDFQPEAEARGLVLSAEVRDASPRVWGDPETLRHLADLLIRNAMEATPSGGSIVFASAGDGQMLRWTVRDNGRGLGADEASRMFDPFFCGRQAGRGLGLGLPRASRIIDRVGGELRWQSAPGLGTTFQVTYPVQESAPNLASPTPARPRGRLSSPVN